MFPWCPPSTRLFEKAWPSQSGACGVRPSERLNSTDLPTETFHGTHHTPSTETEDGRLCPCRFRRRRFDRVVRPLRFPLPEQWDHRSPPTGLLLSAHDRSWSWSKTRLNSESQILPREHRHARTLSVLPRHWAGQASRLGRQ